MEKKSPSDRWAFLRETLEEAKKILSLTPTHTQTYISNLYANLILQIQVRPQNKYRHFTRSDKKITVKEPTLFHFPRQMDDIISLERLSLMISFYFKKHTHFCIMA